MTRKFYTICLLFYFGSQIHYCYCYNYYLSSSLWLVVLHSPRRKTPSRVQLVSFCLVQYVRYTISSINQYSIDDTNIFFFRFYSNSFFSFFVFFLSVLFVLCYFISPLFSFDCCSACTIQLVNLCLTLEAYGTAIRLRTL